MSPRQSTGKLVLGITSHFEPLCFYFVLNYAWQCVRDRSLKRHLSLLWDNGVPLCIEVLLSADCPCAAEKCSPSDISPMPDPHSILLEQWTISGHVKRVHEPLIVGNLGGGVDGRSLLQVIRSYLHFSQLAAWLSLTKGDTPKNVIYRVTMPGEAFASKFTSDHQDHDFPVAVVKDHIIKVSVKSMARSDHVPRAFCSNPICPSRVWKNSPVIESLSMGFKQKENESNDKAGEKDRSGSEGIVDGLPVDERRRSNCQVSGKHCCTEVKISLILYSQKSI